jgi:phosphoesterase RecJ-like protein
MQIDPAQKELLQSWLADRPSILITNHLNPDGDAVGSALGLSRVLQQQGHQVKVLMPNDYAANLKWMEGTSEVAFFDQDEVEGRRLIEEALLIIHLDYNHLGRSGPMEAALAAALAKKMVIDHHQQPDSFPDLLLSDVSMSSTCEMVFHLIDQMGWADLLDKCAAECFYTGIATDTGNFRFSSTSPATHRAVARLLELGVSSQKVASKVYDSNSPGRFKLLGKALSNMELFPAAHTALIYLTAEDLQEAGFQKGDTEGFVNYGLSLAGVELSIFAMPRDGKFKLSLRSKTGFDVNQMARQHFSGGGHRNAAGGSSELSLAETLNSIKEILPTYEEELADWAAKH